MSIDGIRIKYELGTAGRDASSIPVITFTWRTQMNKTCWDNRRLVAVSGISRPKYFFCLFLVL